MRLAVPALIGLALATPLLATPALAQNRAGATARMGAEFTATDANKDGSLSLAEVQARIGRMRTAKSRFTPEQTQRLARLWFARADANKDGKVTQAEANGLLTATFRAYDTDGDGTVTPAERAAARADALKDAKAK